MCTFLGRILRAPAAGQIWKLPAMTSRLLLTLALSAIVAPSFAAKPGNYPPLEFGVSAPAPNETGSDGRFDRASQTPLALYRPNFKAQPADADTMARQFLSERSAALRLAPRSTSHQLRTQSVRDFASFSVVRLQQYWHELAVYGSEIVVTVTPSGEVIFVQQTPQPVDGVPAEAARINGKEALAKAAAYLGAGTGHHFAEVTEMWWNRDQAMRVWRVMLEPTGYPGGSWEVLVNASTGAIVRAENRTLHFDGSGRAFNPDPLSSAQVSYGAPGYVDGNDASTPQLDAQIVNLPLRDLVQVGGQWTLDGPWAKCVDWAAPIGANNCPTSATGTFLYTRDNDNFEAINVHYHIDTYMRYVNVTLNVPVVPRQYSGGVQYDPRGFNGADNSSFSSGTGRLQFGEGGVDDGEDADVIVHELGHGLHDWITNGGLSQAQGLSEGVGDYVAASYSRSFNHWPLNAPQYFWMFDWDGHNPFWGGRITNYHMSATYQTLPGGLHTPGQYWASCNLLNYESIGRQRSDRAFFLGLAMTGASTNQQDAAQAVLNAAAADGYTSNEMQTMYANFTAGTSVPANRRCSYVLTLPGGSFSFANGFE